MPMLVNELLIINFQLVDQAAFLMPASVWQLIVLPLHLKQNKKNPPLHYCQCIMASVFQNIKPRELSMITLINACGAQPIVNGLVTPTQDREPALKNRGITGSIQEYHN